MGRKTKNSENSTSITKIPAVEAKIGRARATREPEEITYSSFSLTEFRYKSAGSICRGMFAFKNLLDS